MHTSGIERNCSAIFFQILKNENKLQILDGGYTCKDLQATYPQSVFDIKNNQLLYKNQIVGSIDDTKLEINFTDPVENYSFQLVLQKENSALKYSERWFENNKPALSITGELYNFSE